MTKALNGMSFENKVRDKLFQIIDAENFTFNLKIFCKPDISAEFNNYLKNEMFI